MSILRTKRSRAIAFGVVAALIVAGGAIAFWTASGTGSGNATVGTDSGLPITAVTFGATIYPGKSVPVSVTIQNPSANTPVTVSQIAANTAAGTNGMTNLGGCLAADFSFPTWTFGGVPVSIPASSSITVPIPTASGLAYANTAVNQDACKGATPTLNLKAS